VIRAIASGIIIIEVQNDHISTSHAFSVCVRSYHERSWTYPERSSNPKIHMNVRQMTKSVDPYPLHSLPINTPYPTSLRTISSLYTYSITLFY
jgi:hypothetical protein